MKMRARLSRRIAFSWRPQLEFLEVRTVPTVVLAEGHADIGMAYENDVWDLHVHDHDNDIEYEPNEALLYATRATKTTQPSDPNYHFIGAGAGNPIWVLPQVQQPHKLFLGIAAEEIPPGTFATYFETDRRIQSAGEWIRLDLVEVRGPAEANFSVWSTDSFGKPIPWMATKTNRPSDTVFTLSGSHVDYNFGFTAKGSYEVDVKASAYLGPGMTNQVESEVVTYHFGVEDCGNFCPPAPLGDSRALATAAVDAANNLESRATVASNHELRSSTPDTVPFRSAVPVSVVPHDSKIYRLVVNNLGHHELRHDDELKLEWLHELSIV